MFIFQVAASIKDKVERELGEGGWQCVVYFPIFFFPTFSLFFFFNVTIFLQVGRRGTFGCCLSPSPDHYFNFDLAQVHLEDQMCR